ncbi:MAG: hypothetical protein KC589_09900 [Nanoarchaeota archaeon]|nr:hypothetical protein [Nanoarchaeota archaeon]
MDFLVKKPNKNQIDKSCWICGEREETGIYLNCCDWCFSKYQNIYAIRKQRDLYHIDRLEMMCQCINKTCKYCKFKEYLMELYKKEWKEEVK